MEWPLVKEPGAALESHGAHFSFLDFEIDLDRYVGEFNEQVIGAYGQGEGAVLPADTGIARSLIPPGTGVFRDFSHVAPALPQFIADKCVACMECVTVCPDTAILGRIAEPDVLASASAEIVTDEERADFDSQWVRTTKFFDVVEKKGERGGMFGIHVDPTKCKGCGECVVACGSHAALEMVEKSDELIETLPQPAPPDSGSTGVAAAVSGQETSRRPDAQRRSLPALRGWRRLVRGLRRGDGDSHDARGHG